MISELLAAELALGIPRRVKGMKELNTSSFSAEAFPLLHLMSGLSGKLKILNV